MIVTDSLKDDGMGPYLYVLNYTRPGGGPNFRIYSRWQDLAKDRDQLAKNGWDTDWSIGVDHCAHSTHGASTRLSEHLLAELERLEPEQRELVAEQLAVAHEAAAQALRLL